MTSSEQPGQSDKPQESLVHPDDQGWGSEEMAAETLKGAKDGSECWLPWEDVEAELAEMRRLGI